MIESQDNPSNLLEYQFREYPIYSKYSRTYVSIFDVMISVGGTWTSLSAIGLVFTLLFSYNLMMSSLIRKLYYFNAKYPGELKKKEKKEKPKKIESASITKEVITKVKNEEDEENATTQLMKKAYAEEQEAKKTGKAKLKDSLKEAFGSAKKKAEFNYLTIGVLKYYCCCRILMKDETLRNKESYRNDLYFNRGLRALDKEFDAGYIIK